MLAEARDERAAVEAVIEAGLEIHAQPIVDLRTGQVVGYEALSRFPGTVNPNPASWLARARRCGLSEQLEAATIRAALALPERPAGTYLSLNISPSLLLSSLLDEVIPEDLTGLVLEVTEHELVAGSDALQRVLAGLRQRGARLAVDDAGAGYAGFTQLLRLQPDIVKLDRTMVDGVANDGNLAALIEAFARFARRIGATVCRRGARDARGPAGRRRPRRRERPGLLPGAPGRRLAADRRGHGRRVRPGPRRGGPDKSAWDQWDTATSEPG